MQVCRIFPHATISIYLLALCFAFAACQTQENNIEDYATSGNYLIVFCNANTAASHAAHLQHLIPYMQANLQNLLTDVDRGTASPAFRTFFKTNNNLEVVRQVFTDIINGSPVLSIGAQNVSRWSPPTIVCADADEPFLYHMRDWCNVPSRPVMNVLQPAKDLSICPIFWTLPRVARKAACPWVANGKLLTEPWNLRTTQYAVLVHELVHVYNRVDNRHELYNLQDVADLNATRSLENAQNFASYAAGELVGCFPSAMGCILVWR